MSENISMEASNESPELLVLVIVRHRSLSSSMTIGFIAACGFGVGTPVSIFSSTARSATPSSRSVSVVVS